MDLSWCPGVGTHSLVQNSGVDLICASSPSPFSSLSDYYEQMGGFKLPRLAYCSVQPLQPMDSGAPPSEELAALNYTYR